MSKAALTPEKKLCSRALMHNLTLPSVKVSPVEHSMPNRATMSPAPASWMSSMSLLCMRTSRGTCPHAQEGLQLMTGGQGAHAFCEQHASNNRRCREGACTCSDDSKVSQHHGSTLVRSQHS